ncbi:MAG: ribonuclease III, partial [Oscillospiraceae bacterium]|nr:ribonuclease III [Oscillospiraceae bacterium]
MEETRNDHMADQLSTLALAHVGDGVYELLVRTRLARQGISRVNDLHRATVALVKAPAQAQAMEKLLPVLTEKELAVYKRGRNTKTHAAPNQATVSEYH